MSLLERRARRSQGAGLVWLLLAAVAVGAREPVLILALGAAVLAWVLLRARTRGRKKTRRAPFKSRHGLTQRQPLEEFEARMAAGMFQEGREVYVTAWCTDTEVVRCTASVGNLTSCRPADDVRRWAHHARRVGADRIRQYHNHPDVLLRSFPSRQDRRSHAHLTELLEGTGVALESWLVWRSWLGHARFKQFGP